MRQENLARSEGVAPPTVLIVEDEILVRRPIAEYLRDCGFAVLEAGDAGEALVIFAVAIFRVDVLFTDVKLPGDRDGFWLAQWVRATKPEIKIIITSGIARMADDAGNLCADGPLMPKPYGPADVERRIRTLLAEGESARTDRRS